MRDLASATPRVYVLRGRRIAKQRIEVGLRDECFVEIEPGLSTGEQVILQNRNDPWVRRSVGERSWRPEASRALRLFVALRYLREGKCRPR